MQYLLEPCRDGGIVSAGSAPSLGALLKDARLKLGWSLREAEAQTGIPNAHLSQIETGAIQQPSFPLARALGLAYDIPLPQLMEAGGYIDAEKYRARQLEERIRADERERLARLAEEVDAFYDAPCPDGDPDCIHQDAPFAKLIRELGPL
jgi:transcriptional regulator with XRE-family HTH domain